MKLLSFGAMLIALWLIVAGVLAFLQYRGDVVPGFGWLAAVIYSLVGAGLYFLFFSIVVMSRFSKKYKGNNFTPMPPVVQSY